MYVLVQHLGDLIYGLINEQSYLFGRTLGDFLLNDETVSSKQAMITIIKDIITLRDLGSSNSTILNGDILTPHKDYIVKPGSQIQFGLKSVFIIQKDEMLIALSGLSTENKNMCKKLIELFDYKLASKWSSDVTHVIVPDNILTKKLLCGIICKQHIVTINYLVSRWNRVKKYINLPQTLERQYTPLNEGFIMPIVDSFDRSKLFKGKSFVFASVSHLSIYGHLIQLAGGRAYSIEKSKITTRHILSKEYELLVVELDEDSQTSSDEFQNLMQLFRDNNRRTIPQNEIAMAIVAGHTKTFCNSHFAKLESLVEDVPPASLGDVVVPDTEAPQLNTAQASLQVAVVAETQCPNSQKRPGDEIEESSLKRKKVVNSPPAGQPDNKTGSQNTSDSLKGESTPASCNDRWSMCGSPSSLFSNEGQRIKDFVEFESPGFTLSLNIIDSPIKATPTDLLDKPTKRKDSDASDSALRLKPRKTARTLLLNPSSTSEISNESATTTTTPIASTSKPEVPSAPSTFRTKVSVGHTSDSNTSVSSASSSACQNASTSEVKVLAESNSSSKIPTPEAPISRVQKPKVPPSEVFTLRLNKPTPIHRDVAVAVSSKPMELFDIKPRRAKKKMDENTEEKEMPKECLSLKRKGKNSDPINKKAKTNTATITCPSSVVAPMFDVIVPSKPAHANSSERLTLKQPTLKKPAPASKILVGGDIGNIDPVMINDIKLNITAKSCTHKKTFVKNKMRRSTPPLIVATKIRSVWSD